MKVFLRLILCSALLLGCNINTSIDQAKVAEKQTRLFYSLVDRDMDSALILFDDSFFQNISKEEVKAILKEIKERYGSIVKSELIKKERGITQVHGKRISYLHLYYKNVYSSGFTSIERFDFHPEDKNFKLIGAWRFYEWGKAPVEQE